MLLLALDGELDIEVDIEWISKRRERAGRAEPGVGLSVHVLCLVPLPA